MNSDEISVNLNLDDLEWAHLDLNSDCHENYLHLHFKYGGYLRLKEDSFEEVNIRLGYGQIRDISNKIFNSESFFDFETANTKSLIAFADHYFFRIYNIESWLFVPHEKSADYYSKFCINVHFGDSVKEFTAEGVTAQRNHKRAETKIPYCAVSSISDTANKK